MPYVTVSVDLTFSDAHSERDVVGLLLDALESVRGALAADCHGVNVNVSRLDEAGLGETESED